MNLFSIHNPTDRLIWDATALAAACRDPFTYVVNVNHGFKYGGDFTKFPKFIFGQLWGEFIQFYYMLLEHNRRNTVPWTKELTEYVLETFNQWAIADGLDVNCNSDTEKVTCSKDMLLKCIRLRIDYNDFAGIDNKTGLVFIGNEPAIEVGFIVHTNLFNEYNEEYLLSGYLDLITYNLIDPSILYPRETKTTRSSYGDAYINNKLFPSIQFRTYEVITKALYNDGNYLYEGIDADICNIYKKNPPSFTVRNKRHNDWEIEWWFNQIIRIIKRYSTMAKEGRLSLDVALSYDPECDPEGLVRYRSENNPEPLADLFDKNPIERESLVRGYLAMAQPSPWDPTIDRDSKRLIDRFNNIIGESNV